MAEGSMSYRSIYRPGLFASQVFIVTGGGSGIGRCTAHELASLGARVAIVGRAAEKLERVKAEIEAAGGLVSTHVCDIRDDAAVIETVQAVLRLHGRIDGLVNNAGGQYFSPIEGIWKYNGNRRPLVSCAVVAIERACRAKSTSAW